MSSPTLSRRRNAKALASLLAAAVLHAALAAPAALSATNPQAQVSPFSTAIEDAV